MSCDYIMEYSILFFVITLRNMVVIKKKKMTTHYVFATVLCI